MSNKRRQRAEGRKGRQTDRLNDRACGRGTPHKHRGGDLSQHNILCYSPPFCSILDGLLGLLLLLPLEPVHVGFEQVAVGQLEPDPEEGVLLYKNKKSKELEK
jgi:hypothetical protein